MSFGSSFNASPELSLGSNFSTGNFDTAASFDLSSLNNQFAGAELSAPKLSGSWSAQLSAAQFTPQASAEFSAPLPQLPELPQFSAPLSCKEIMS